MFGCFRRIKQVTDSPEGPEMVLYPEMLKDIKSELAIAQMEICEIKDEWANHSKRALSSSLWLEQIKSQISIRSHRRDEASLFIIFKNIKHPDEKALRKEKLKAACEAAGMDNADETTIKELLCKLNVESEDALSFEEFKSLIAEPSELESVMKTIPFHQVFADAVPRKAGSSPMKVFAELTPIEIDMMVQASVESLKDHLIEQSSKLKRVQHRLEQDAEKFKAGNSKFSCFTMSSGQIDDFHEGLGSRIGPPDLNFVKSMALEHCSKAGCRDPFTAGNYVITTCPYKEWKITVDFEIELAIVKHGRQLKKISELVQSEVATQAKLSTCEVIAVVLYTGPMVFVPF